MSSVVLAGALATRWPVERSTMSIRASPRDSTYSPPTQLRRVRWVLAVSVTGPLLTARGRDVGVTDHSNPSRHGPPRPPGTADDLDGNPPSPAMPPWIQCFPGLRATDAAARMEGWPRR